MPDSKVVTVNPTNQTPTMAFITFQTFNTYQEASEVRDILQQSGIEASILRVRQIFDAVIVGGNNAETFELKMDSKDFSNAREILYDSPNFKVERVSPNHPLYEMTNDELQDIVSKPDEWGPENYNIALTLLKTRGHIITNDTINKLHEERTIVLSKAKPMGSYILILGYLTAIVPLIANFLREHEPDGQVIWYFPGFVGLVISWVILQTKVTLPDGRRVPAYTNVTLTHGLVIFALNIISWVANFLIFAGLLF